LVVGLFTRWAAIPLAIVMVFDLLLFHPPSGFFVEDSGYEHALLQLIACVALVVAGPGIAALGSLLASWIKSCFHADKSSVSLSPTVRDYRLRKRCRAYTHAVWENRMGHQ
jgi:hypothetical protein